MPVPQRARMLPFLKNNAYMASYCRKYNKKKLRYSVSNIILKGNKATVTLKVTYPDAYKPLLKTCEAMNWNGYSYNSRTGQKKMQSYVKKYTKRFGGREDDTDSDSFFKEDEEERLEDQCFDPGHQECHQL